MQTAGETVAKRKIGGTILAQNEKDIADFWTLRIRGIHPGSW